MTRSFKSTLLASCILTAASLAVIPANAHEGDGPGTAGQLPTVSTYQPPIAKAPPISGGRHVGGGRQGSGRDGGRNGGNNGGVTNDKPLMPGAYIESSIEDSTTHAGKLCIRWGDCHYHVDTLDGDPIGQPVLQPVPKPKPKGNGQGRVEPKRVGQFQLWPLSDGTYQVTDLNQNPIMGIESGSSLQGFALAPSPR